MVTMEQAIRGICRYVESDILPHLDGWKKFGVSVYMELAASEAKNKIEELADNPAIRMLGIIDDDGNVDIVRLSQTVMTKMEGGKVDLPIPVIGTVTFHPSDITRLCEMMQA